jgi:cytochrome c
MRKSVVLSLATATLLVSAGSAIADVDKFKRYNCSACHATERQLFGPALKAIAEKYANDSGAEARLAKTIQAGGVGVWGQLPMPAQPRVTDEDALILARYVLSIK